MEAFAESAKRIFKRLLSSREKVWLIGFQYSPAQEQVRYCIVRIKMESII